MGVVFKKFFQCYIMPINRVGRWGVGGQANRVVVNEEWERGEIVMCIAIPDTSIRGGSKGGSWGSADPPF